MIEKPLILITNDDGIQAKGLRTLVRLMRALGEVVVVASEQSQSAMGHAITMKVPLHFRRVHEEPGYTEYITNGMPADCVKLGLHKLLDRKPDLVVSGINHGSNASINIIYSGTMAAVLEAAMGGIPAIGFSLLDYSPDADFSAAEPFITALCSKVLQDGMQEGIGYNVNFPVFNGSPYKGITVCRQARSYWKEDFNERYDPRTNQPYYWLTGTFHILEDEPDTDEYALKNYYASLVPVRFDFTAHHALRHVENSIKDLHVDVVNKPE